MAGVPTSYSLYLPVLRWLEDRTGFRTVPLLLAGGAPAAEAPIQPLPETAG